MPLFITQGRYTQTAIKGMAAKPEDRKAAVAALMESAGGKLHEYYVTLGDYDFLIVSEAPDNQTVLKVLVTAGATGGVSNLTTTTAFTTAEFAEAAAAAHGLIAGFRPAGAG